MHGERAGTIRVGLIGAGFIAGFVHIPGLRQCPEVKVVAICDLKREAAEAYAARYGIPTVVTDYQKLLDDPGIDAVVICVPNSLHRQVALEAMQAGKHLLCEKPLGLNLGQAREMTAALRQTQLRGLVAFTYRYAPCVQYARHLVSAGHIGAVRQMRALFALAMPDTWLEWRSMQAEAGGALVDLGSHLIDFGRWFIGEVASVAAMAKTFVPERPVADGSGMRSVDVDDASALLLEFANGATGTIEATRIGKGWGRRERGHIHLELNGTEGSIVCCLVRPFEIRMAGGRLLVEENHLVTVPVPREFLMLSGAVRNPLTEPPQIGYRYDQALQFVQSIREGRDLGPTFEDGMRVQAITDAATLAARERRWVPVEEVVR
jgi:predicted dehydrogenase